MTTRTVKTTLIAEVSGYVQGIEKAAKKTKELGSESEKLAQKKQGLTDLGNAGLAIGALAAAGVAAAVAKFADFDRAMSNVQAATQESTANMDLLREAALDAGGETVYSASEAAAAIEELGKAGLTTSDILGGGLTGALDLAAAGQLDVARAAEITAITLQQFKLDGDRATDVADLLAAGAGKAAGDVDDLAQALNQSALVAAQTGLSVEETTGILSAFASAGLLGSDAGTSLRTALQRLTPQSAEAKKEMERLGISAYDAQGDFIGAAEFAGVLQGGLKDLTDEQRNASLAVIFGSDAVRAASVLYEEGADGIQDWIDKTDDSGYAAQVAADRLDNLAGDVEKLGGAFDTALIRSGSAANDMLRDMVEGATFLVDSVGDLPEPVLNAATIMGVLAASTGLASGAALTAIPRIADFKTSLGALNITAGSAVRSIALTGGAMAGATLAIGYFVGRAADAKATTSALRDSLDETTGALTDYSRELVTTKLAESGAFDAAERAGVSQRELTEAVLEGGDALQVIQDKIAGTNTLFTFFDGTGIAAGNASNAISDLAGAVENSQNQFEQVETATDDSTDSMEAMAAAAAETEQAVDDLSETIRGFGQVQLDANAAQRDFEQSIDDAAQALIDNGATMDLNTQQGRDNQAAIDGIAQSTNEYAAALYDQNGSIEEASAALAAGREKYIEAAVAAGISREAAEGYADALFATPDTITTQAVLTGLEDAQTALDRFITGNDGRTVRVSAGYRALVGQPVANADGNLHSYASGGIAEGLYSGGTPLYKFAEPETRWEAFISGKPGEEQRNLGIWAEAGRRLGADTAQAGPTTVSLAGARISLDVGGRQIEGVIREQIVQADQAGRMTIANGKKSHY